MKRLPLLLDESPSPLARACAYLLVPIALIVALPILMLVILAFYLLAIFQGGRFFVLYVRGKHEPVDLEIRKPHFLDMPAEVKALPDKSAPST